MNWNPSDRNREIARHRFLEARLALLAGQGVIADVLHRPSYEDNEDMLEIEISDFECSFDADDPDDEFDDDEDGTSDDDTDLGNDEEQRDEDEENSGRRPPTGQTRKPASRESGRSGQGTGKTGQGGHGGTKRRSQ